MLFLTDLVLLRVTFLRIISSWLNPAFSVSFLTKPSTKIFAGEITQCRIICVTYWWKLAQVRVFSSMKTHWRKCFHNQEIIRRLFWPVIFDSHLSKLMEYWSVAQHAYSILFRPPIFLGQSHMKVHYRNVLSKKNGVVSQMYQPVDANTGS